MGKKKKKKKKTNVDIRDDAADNPTTVAPAAASETGGEVRPADFEVPPTSTYIEGDLVQFVDAGQIVKGLVSHIPDHLSGGGGNHRGGAGAETKFDVE